MAEKEIPARLKQLDVIVGKMTSQEVKAVEKILSWVANHAEATPQERLVAELYKKFDIWSDAK